MGIQKVEMLQETNHLVRETNGYFPTRSQQQNALIGCERRVSAAFMGLFPSPRDVIDAMERTRKGIERLPCPLYELSLLFLSEWYMRSITGGSEPADMITCHCQFAR